MLLGAHCILGEWRSLGVVLSVNSLNLT
jgi:hypothetical protein